MIYWRGAHARVNRKWKGACEFVDKLRCVCGTHFLLFLGFNYVAVKGIALQALGALELPYFHAMNVSATVYQKYLNITLLAFAVKPLIGVVSDNIPIGGYHKRYYALTFSIGAAAALWLSWSLPQVPAYGAAAAACFFCAAFGIAGLDLLSEGKYSEIMASKPQAGTSIVSFVWLCLSVGGVVAACIEGPIADHVGASLVILVIAPLPLLLAPSILSGAFPETVAHNNCCRASRSPPSDSSHSPSAQRGLLLLSVLTSLAAVGFVLAQLFLSHAATLVFVSIAVAILGVASFSLLEKAVANVILFVLTKEVLYVQMGGYLDYWFTADASCVADGPHFSFAYYQTFAPIVAFCAGLLGIAVFERHLSCRPLCFVVCLTAAMRIAASFFDLAIVLRWNRTYLGLSDKLFFICGDGIIGEITMMLDLMPITVLISKMCVRGHEATTYALLAGFSNLGQNISRTLGYVIGEAIRIETLPPCNFSALPMYIVASHMAAPLLVIPLAYMLLPRGEGISAPTGAGSLPLPQASSPAPCQPQPACDGDAPPVASSTELQPLTQVTS